MRAIDRRIWALFAPSVIATVTTPLLSLMDTAFTGHMGGERYLAAVALGGNIFNMLYWPFGFLRAGTSGLTAQATGAADMRESTRLLLRSLLLALAIGVVLIALQGPVAWLFRLVMAPDEGVWQLAARYFGILVWGAPAMLASYGLAGWFVGAQNTRAAMWMSIAVNVANIAVTALLVVGLGMKVEGVAIGTLVAQYLGVGIGLAIVLRRFRPARGVTLREVLDPAALRRFFAINTVILLRTLCLIAVTLWFTRAGAAQGSVVLAANALLMQFFMLFSYVTDGVAYAAEALVGADIGAHRYTEARVTARRVTLWSGVIALLFTALYWVGGVEGIALLTSDVATRDVAATYLPYAVAVPLISFTAFTADGIFIGAALTRPLFSSMAWATVTFFAAWWLLTPLLANHALWLAFLLYLLVRGLLLAYRWERTY